MTQWLNDLELTVKFFHYFVALTAAGWISKKRVKNLRQDENQFQHSIIQQCRNKATLVLSRSPTSVRWIAWRQTLRAWCLNPLKKNRTSQNSQPTKYVDRSRATTENSDFYLPIEISCRKITNISQTNWIFRQEDRTTRGQKDKRTTKQQGNRTRGQQRTKSRGQLGNQKTRHIMHLENTTNGRQIYEHNRTK